MQCIGGCCSILFQWESVTVAHMAFISVKHINESYQRKSGLIESCVTDAGQVLCSS